MTKAYDYDAFGNEKELNANDQNPFRYCGEYFDPETGTYYLRARYYDPAIGRFTQEDTYQGDYKDPLSLNRYTYCYGNPIFYIDPTGLSGIMPDGSYYLSRNKKNEEMKGDALILKYMKQLYAEGVYERKRYAIIRRIENVMSKGEQFDYWSVNYTYGIEYYTIYDITDDLTNLMTESAANEPRFKSTSQLSFGEIMVKYYYFSQKVGSEKQYDLKSQERWNHRHFIFMGEVIDWDDPGNILYGYLGSAMGFTSLELLAGAGCAQVLDGTSSWKFRKSFFDDPKDQQRIKQGIYLYYNMGVV